MVDFYFHFTVHLGRSYLGLISYGLFIQIAFVDYEFRFVHCSGSSHCLPDFRKIVYVMSYYYRLVDQRLIELFVED